MALGALVKFSGNVVNPTLPYVPAWDAEDFDTSAFHDNSTNNTRLTIPSGVTKVRLTTTVATTATVTGGSNMLVTIFKGGAIFVGTGYQNFHTGTTDASFSVATAPLDVTTGDYFESRINCSDTTLTLDAALCSFGIEVLNASAFRGAMVHLSSNVVSPSLPYTVVWDAEDYDTDAIHDNTTNKTRLTVPGGVTKVRVRGTVACTGTVSSSSRYKLSIQKGGADFVGSGKLEWGTGFTTAGGTVETPVLTVSSGNYFEIVLDCSDATITLDSGHCSFAMEIVE